VHAAHPAVPEPGSAGGSARHDGYGERCSAGRPLGEPADAWTRRRTRQPAISAASRGAGFSLTEDMATGPRWGAAETRFQRDLGEIGKLVEGCHGAARKSRAHVLRLQTVNRIEADTPHHQPDGATSYRSCSASTPAPGPATKEDSVAVLHRAVPPIPSRAQSTWRHGHDLAHNARDRPHGPTAVLRCHTRLGPGRGAGRPARYAADERGHGTLPALRARRRQRAHDRRDRVHAAVTTRAAPAIDAVAAELQRPASHDRRLKTLLSPPGRRRRVGLQTVRSSSARSRPVLDTAYDDGGASTATWTARAESDPTHPRADRRQPSTAWGRGTGP